MSGSAEGGGVSLADPWPPCTRRGPGPRQAVKVSPGGSPPRRLRLARQRLSCLTRSQEPGAWCRKLPQTLPSQDEPPPSQRLRSPPSGLGRHPYERGVCDDVRLHLGVGGTARGGTLIERVRLRGSVMRPRPVDVPHGSHCVPSTTTLVQEVITLSTSWSRHLARGSGLTRSACNYGSEQPVNSLSEHGLQSFCPGH